MESKKAGLFTRAKQRFVACMEDVPDIYKRPYDKNNPVVYMNESPKQLIASAHTPIPMQKREEKKFSMIHSLIILRDDKSRRAGVNQTPRPSAIPLISGQVIRIYN